jgi:hypothetical protein
VVSRRCACGTVTAGAPPEWVVGPAGYGPELAAQAANMLCGHYLPVGRSAELLAATLGVKVSTGFLAGIRRRAAGRLEDTRSCPGSATCSLVDALHAWCGSYITRIIARRCSRQ